MVMAMVMAMAMVMTMVIVTMMIVMRTGEGGGTSADTTLESAWRRMAAWLRVVAASQISSLQVSGIVVDLSGLTLASYYGICVATLHDYELRCVEKPDG